MEHSSVIVTGAGRGMGRSHALAAAELGLHVFVTDVIDTQETVDLVTQAGGRATGHTLDITYEGQWHDLINFIAESGYIVSGLVNNAGIPFRRGITDTTAAEFRRVLDVNVTGAFLGTKAVAPLMAARGHGSIVNIGSIAGATGNYSAAYGVSKWALRGLTKSAVVEWGGHGVRINTVLPGLIMTPLLEGAAETLIPAFVKSVPAGRAGTSDDVARIVKFLLSEESTYVNGADYVVDGGASSAGYYHRVMADM